MKSPADIESAGAFVAIICDQNVKTFKTHARLDR